MHDQGRLDLKHEPSKEKDIFLCHSGAQKPWVEILAQRIEAEPYGDRNLAVVFDKWDFPKGENIVTNIEKYIDGARFVGIVVSRAMLQSEWPTLERSIAVWSDPSGARGRVIPNAALFTVNLFWRIATEIYSLGEFQSLLHHSAR